MFEKIKEVANSSGTVKEINDILKENKETLVELNKDILELKTSIVELKQDVNSQINEIRETHSLFLNTFKEELEKAEEFNKKFIDLAEEFRTHRHKMQESMFEKTSSEVEKEIERLKLDVNRYNELKKEIDGVSPLIMDLKGEVNKFKEISSKIKNQDFELIRFSDKVAQLEKEKSGLNEKIDTLQRLISRERRHH